MAYLVNVWAYTDANLEEIEQALQEQEAAMYQEHELMANLYADQ